MITVQKMRLYGLGIAALFRGVGRSENHPGAMQMEGTGAKRYLSGNGFAERMARRRP